MADLALSLAPSPTPFVAGAGLPLATLPADLMATPISTPVEGAADPFAELMATLTSAAAAVPMTTPAAVPPTPSVVTPAAQPPVLPPVIGESVDLMPAESKKKEEQAPDGNDPLGTAIAAGATAVLALNQLMPPAPPSPPPASVTTPPPVAIQTAAVTLRVARPVSAAPTRAALPPAPAEGEDAPVAAEVVPAAEPTIPAAAETPALPDAQAPAEQAGEPPVASTPVPTIVSEQQAEPAPPAHRLAAFTRLLQRTTTLAPVAHASPVAARAQVEPAAPSSPARVKAPAAPPQPAPESLDPRSAAPSADRRPEAIATAVAADPVAVTPQPTSVVAPVPEEAALPPVARPASLNAPAPSQAPARAPAHENVTPAASTPERRRAEVEPPAAPFTFGQAAPLVSNPAPAVAAAAPLADAGLQQELSIAQDGQWLDSLARDIAMSASGDSTLHFKLNPAHLGTLAVQIAQGTDGASIRLTADSDAARTILVDAQPKLIAEARAQGLRIADAQVDLSQNNTGGSSPRGGEAAAGQMGQQQQAGQQSRQPLPDRQPLAVNHSADPEPGERAGDSGELYA